MSVAQSEVGGWRRGGGNRRRRKRRRINLARGIRVNDRMRYITVENRARSRVKVYWIERTFLLLVSACLLPGTFTFFSSLSLFPGCRASCIILNQLRQEYSLNHFGPTFEYDFNSGGPRFEFYMWSNVTSVLEIVT